MTASASARLGEQFAEAERRNGRLADEKAEMATQAHLGEYLGEFCMDRSSPGDGLCGRYSVATISASMRNISGNISDNYHAQARAAHEKLQYLG